MHIYLVVSVNGVIHLVRKNGVIHLIGNSGVVNLARLLGELREKTRAAAAAADTAREVDGSEVNNLFFEWQQARDVEMLNRLGLGLVPCL